MLYESAAACHAAVAALGVEVGVDERYEGCLVDALVSDGVSDILCVYRWYSVCIRSGMPAICGKYTKKY